MIEGNPIPTYWLYPNTFENEKEKKETSECDNSHDEHFAMNSSQDPYEAPHTPATGRHAQQNTD